MIILSNKKQKINLEEVLRLRQLTKQLSTRVTLLEKRELQHKEYVNMLEETIKLKDTIIKKQKNIIEKFTLQIEELRRIVFKPKKKKKHDKTMDKVI